MVPKKTLPPGLASLFPEFQAFLYESSGIYFPAQKTDRLLGHVAARMQALGKTDPREYLQLLKSSSGTHGEKWEFFSQATVNETYFFREPAQFDVFRDKILPALFQNRRKHGRDKVHILSAACSSGDEAYSLAILIKERFPGEAPFVAIHGIDIDKEIVNQAKAGEYREYRVRNLTDRQRQTFFTQQQDRWLLRPDVRAMARFQVLNMSDGWALKQLPRPDLLLCRNALIYFDQKSKEAVVNNFARILLPHGYLFLSQTESLFGIQNPFELVHFFKTCAYRLRGGAD